MPHSNVVVREYNQDNNVMYLTLNRPEKLNAVDHHLLDELSKALEIVAEQKELDALMIKSASSKAFCAGLDIKSIQSVSNKGAATFFSKLANVLERIANLTCPTIAIVNGYAFGAGADIALACDFRIGGKSSVFSFPGPQFGVVLGTHRLVNELGASIARKLALSNEKVPAEKALAYGVIHEISEDESSFDTGLAYVEKVKHVPSHTLKNIKQICGRQVTEQMTPERYVEQSVLEGDFQERLSQYINRMKQK